MISSPRAGSFGLRPATEADIEAAAVVQLTTALHAYADIFPSAAPKPTLSDMESNWKEILADGQGWVAVTGGDAGGLEETDETVVGVAGLVPEETGSRLTSVYVYPTYAGSGIGSWLVDSVEAEAVARGWLPLKLWVLEANERARDWYRARGWVPDAAQRRTVWDDIDDVGYVLGEPAATRWRR